METVYKIPDTSTYKRISFLIQISKTKVLPLKVYSAPRKFIVDWISIIPYSSVTCSFTRKVNFHLISSQNYILNTIHYSKVDAFCVTQIYLCYLVVQLMQNPMNSCSFHWNDFKKILFCLLKWELFLSVL